MFWQPNSDDNMDNHQKKRSFDIEKYKNIIKGISIDKWLLIGLAGLVLIWCSDSCTGSSSKNGNSADDSKSYGIAGSSLSENDLDDHDGGAIDISLETYTSELEKELEDMLMSIDGAGDVKVMLKEATGAETVKKRSPSRGSFLRTVQEACPYDQR